MDVIFSHIIAVLCNIHIQCIGIVVSSFSVIPDQIILTVVFTPDWYLDAADSCRSFNSAYCHSEFSVSYFADVYVSCCHLRHIGICGPQTNHFAIFIGSIDVDVIFSHIIIMIFRVNINAITSIGLAYSLIPDNVILSAIFTPDREL